MKLIVRLAVATALFAILALAFFYAYLLTGAYMLGASVGAPAWLGYPLAIAFALLFFLFYAVLLDFVLKKARL